MIILDWMSYAIDKTSTANFSWKHALHILVSFNVVLIKCLRPTNDVIPWFHEYHHYYSISIRANDYFLCFNRRVFIANKSRRCRARTSPGVVGYTASGGTLMCGRWWLTPITPAASCCRCCWCCVPLYRRPLCVISHHGNRACASLPVSGQTKAALWTVRPARTWARLCAAEVSDNHRN